MGKPSRLLARLILPFLVLPISAQTATNVQANTSQAAASPSSANQAPDEMTKKITELVHAGKYPEAQKLTTGLLVAYPDDQRLVKAKALIEKLLPPPAFATPSPNSSEPTNIVIPAQPALNTSVEQLTGMEKVDYDALIELAQQAQQTTDLDQQTTLLRQFMKDSDLFLQKHPTEMLLWQLRAASAISLKDPLAGYEAGQKLLTVGAANSNDLNLQRLLAQLKNQGWLDQQGVEDYRRKVQTEQDRENLVITVSPHVVLVPVVVKDSTGRLVSDLLLKDFSVLENGQKQTLNSFTIDTRNQYTLGYTPKSGIGGYRGIEVRVRRANLQVYARDGYYALPTAPN